VIRAAGPGDAAAIAAIYAPYVLDGYATFEEEPPDAAEMGARMLAEPRRPWLVAERAGAVVGYAYASPHHARAGYRWTANVSVYLAVDERGKGTGRALYDVLLAALGSLGYVHAYAGIALPNDASVRLHEACGFTRVGVYERVGFKQGAWRDVGWWHLLLQEPPAEPTPPAPSS
jgi:L-amino acid N-acyltransferase YncA